jgi:hypothetical protein
MEIVQILINAYVVLDGQETIVNFQYVMESIPPIYLSATREEFVLLLIIVLAIQIMKVLIVSTPFVMEFPTENPPFVHLMEIVFLQMYATVQLFTVEIIVNIQFVMVLFPMKRRVAPTLQEVLVCPQIIVHVPLDTLEQHVNTIYVLDLIQANLMFVLLMEIVHNQINANVMFITLVLIVNILIFMNLFLLCVVSIVPLT